VVRGIVFDLFDTLVDQNHDQLAPVTIDGRLVGATTPALHAGAHAHFGVELPTLEFADLLRSVDQDLRVKTIDQGLELPTLERFKALGTRLGLNDPLAFGDEMTEIHMGALRTAVSVPTHHESVLVSLAVDFPIGICSNFTHAETARAVLDDASFSEHLSAVVISEEIGVRKPRPEIFQAVAAGLGLAPKEILHVGDNLRADVGGAKALGMTTVWLTRQVVDPERELANSEGPDPDFALEDLVDLPVLVARLSV
jgi:FMN phosphatase YigB (HAD superfamily)